MGSKTIDEIIEALEGCNNGGEDGLPKDGLQRLIADLKRVASGGNVPAVNSLRIGDQVRMFCDNNWYGVVTAVELRMGRQPRYCIEYRQGRDICERWLCKEQLDAYSKLGEVEV